MRHSKQSHKVYKITYGTLQIEDDLRKKAPNVEILDCYSVKVLATDVFDAVLKTEGYVKQLEKEEKKERFEVFTQSIELLEVIDVVG